VASEVTAVESYVTLEEANAYMDGRLDSAAWECVDDHTRRKALVEATRRIDMQRWRGRKKDSDQEHAFPRCFWEPHRRCPEKMVISTDDRLGPGWWCESEVSQAVKDATCEEALAILRAAQDPAGEMRRRLQEQGVTSISMSRSSETYAKEIVLAKSAGQGLMSPVAKQLLMVYELGSAGVV